MTPIVISIVSATIALISAVFTGVNLKLNWDKQKRESLVHLYIRNEKNADGSESWFIGNAGNELCFVNILIALQNHGPHQGDAWGASLPSPLKASDELPITWKKPIPSFSEKGASDYVTFGDTLSAMAYIKKTNGKTMGNEQVQVAVRRG